MPPRDAAVANGSSPSDAEMKSLKNKPKASRLRQQKLPAWQPILTASTVIPTVICVGIVFIPIGIALFLASESVKEHISDYTNCSDSTCRFVINVTEPMEGDVYVYYYLENFYQNHRRYVKSRNDKQYLGHLDSVSDCEPFDKASVNGRELPIAPCGAIANSIFNDSFTIEYQNPLTFLYGPVPLTSEGVLWDVDQNKKFKNPEIPAGQTLCDVFANTAKPPNWKVNPCENGGFTNVDFIVWMRTAALPSFRKLWRLVKRNDPVFTQFQQGLPAGQYQITVANNYPVTSFGGRKSFVMSTTSWAGGKNSFLGIAYLVVGSLSIVLAIIFIIIHIKFGHSVNELSNVAAGNQ